MEMELDWRDARILCRMRLGPAVAELMEACDEEDIDAVLRLAREIRDAADDLATHLRS